MVGLALGSALGLVEAVGAGGGRSDRLLDVDVVLFGVLVDAFVAATTFVAIALLVELLLLLRCTARVAGPSVLGRAYAVTAESAG